MKINNKTLRNIIIVFVLLVIAIIISVSTNFLGTGAILSKISSGNNALLATVNSVKISSKDLNKAKKINDILVNSSTLRLNTKNFTKDLTEEKVAFQSKPLTDVLLLEDLIRANYMKENLNKLNLSVKNSEIKTAVKEKINIYKNAVEGSPEKLEYSQLRSALHTCDVSDKEYIKTYLPIIIESELVFNKYFNMFVESIMIPKDETDKENQLNKFYPFLYDGVHTAKKLGTIVINSDDYAEIRVNK